MEIVFNFVEFPLDPSMFRPGFVTKRFLETRRLGLCGLETLDAFGEHLEPRFERSQPLRRRRLFAHWPPRVEAGNFVTDVNDLDQLPGEEPDADNSERAESPDSELRDAKLRAVAVCQNGWAGVGLIRAILHRTPSSSATAPMLEAEVIRVAESATPGAQRMERLPVLADLCPLRALAVGDPLAVDEQVQVLSQSLIVQRSTHMTAPVLARSFAQGQLPVAKLDEQQKPSQTADEE